MTVLFWVLVAIFALDVVAGLYYFVQDGYHAGNDTRYFGMAMYVVLVTWLLIVAPLSGFGWVLVGLFVYSFFINLYKIVAYPDGVWKSGASVALGIVISGALLALLFIVGL